MSQTAAAAERLAESHKTTRYIVGYAAALLWRERGSGQGNIITAIDEFAAQDAETQAALIYAAAQQQPGMAA